MARNRRNDSTLRKITLGVIFVLIALILVFILSMMYDTWSAKVYSEQQSIKDIDVTYTPQLQTATPLPIVESTPTATPYAVLQLPYVDPIAAGFDAEKISELDNYIKGQVSDGFPGAVLMIAKDGNIVYNKAYGYQKKYDGYNLLSEFENMQVTTMFDLASLSKIYATTFSIMKLVDEGLVLLDGKVSDYLTDYSGENKDKITVRMLLSHNSGYVDNVFFYKDDSPYKTSTRDEVYSFAKKITPDYEPGEKYDYNDLNYIILGMIVEEVSGMRIDEYAKINIYEPLGIAQQVTYRPLDNGIAQHAIAATERNGNTRDGAVYFEGIRQYTLQGEVHDENAYYSMDQVSGHAGLFATSYGLTLLNQVLLNGGTYNGIRIYKQETVDNWLSISGDVKYQLGYWNAAAASDKLKSYVSSETFYHNGWTGTATIVDKENNLSIILLTNKRHSPCPGGDFQGTDYSIAYYTAVIQRVYKALEN